jgi:hypothetical protein
MIAAVLLATATVLSLLTIGIRGDRRSRLVRLIPTALVLALVGGAAFSTALGSTLTGRWHATFIVVGLVAAAIGGNHVTLAVFDAIDQGHIDQGHIDQGPEEEAAVHSAEPSAAEPGSLRSAGAVLRGGAWIGILERLAVFATLAARWPEGIAVVLAVKGLGRYPELRTGHRPGLAERFIIGTLVSVLWAGLCAYAATGPTLG